jgi:hypothetical protein
MGLAVRGIAFHEFQDVPTFPASHGCVRQSVTVAQWTYAFAPIGMPVKVIATVIALTCDPSVGPAR